MSLLTLDEFKASFALLRGAYGERSFPKERESVFWDRYKHASNLAFKSTVERIVLRMPPPGAVIDWLDDALGKPSGSAVPVASAFVCEPCRDFGFGFVGETVVRCETCATGRSVNPQALAREQARYDRAKKLFKSPFPELPYDPNERQGA